MTFPPGTRAQGQRARGVSGVLIVSHKQRHQGTFVHRPGMGWLWFCLTNLPLLSNQSTNYCITCNIPYIQWNICFKVKNILMTTGWTLSHLACHKTWFRNSSSLNQKLGNPFPREILDTYTGTRLNGGRCYYTSSKAQYTPPPP